MKINFQPFNIWNQANKVPQFGPQYSDIGYSHINIISAEILLFPVICTNTKSISYFADILFQHKQPCQDLVHTQTAANMPLLYYHTIFLHVYDAIVH